MVITKHKKSDTRNKVPQKNAYLNRYVLDANELRTAEGKSIATMPSTCLWACIETFWSHVSQSLL